MSAANSDWQIAVRAAINEERQGLFHHGKPVVAARAPGRLDVMGGVADYSGGLVLEGTLAAGTYAAVQKRNDGKIVVRSLNAERAGWRSTAETHVSEFVDCGTLVSFASVLQTLTANPLNRWAAYCSGCVYVLLDEGRLNYDEAAGGIAILIDSDLPLGAGVSSSAAVEVATMKAVTGLYDIAMDGLELARLCQIVENRVVGAPCGIMDQVTCSLGRPNALLRLLCRPYELQGYAKLPAGWGLAGIDSGVKHSVGGGNYRRARAAAFMGLAIIQRTTGNDYGGYLCSLTPEEWKTIRMEVPETLTGEEYTRRFGAVPDPLSILEPQSNYRVRASVEHAVLEQDRVQSFDQLMSESVQGTAELRKAGQLMLEAHRSYSERIDLGSPETDLLVQLAMEAGEANGVFGAKITGGGSGGTVAILAYAEQTAAATQRIAAEYRHKTGIEPAILLGSSPGAMETGLTYL